MLPAYKAERLYIYKAHQRKSASLISQFALDPFHVVKRLNQAIGETRNRYYKPILRQLETNPDNPSAKKKANILQGTSRLIKTWDSNLPKYWDKDEPKARKRLQDIFTYFPDIQEVYEAVQDYHNSVMLELAPLRKAALSEWIRRYESSYVGELRDAVKTLNKYKEKIINSLTHGKTVLREISVQLGDFSVFRPYYSYQLSSICLLNI